jgi:hypothetical protein
MTTFGAMENRNGLSKKARLTNVNVLDTPEIFTYLPYPFLYRGFYPARIQTGHPFSFVHLKPNL